MLDSMFLINIMTIQISAAYYFDFFFIDFTSISLTFIDISSE